MSDDDRTDPADPAAARFSPDDEESFSAQLERWLREAPSRTIGDLVDWIDEKSFALVLMLLLLPSALPIPTGGVTHVLELAALLVAGQMALGRRELWLPRRVLRHDLSGLADGKALRRIIGPVRWFERVARPRFARLLDTRPVTMALGLVTMLFVVGALVAPPFSGLDTLPSLGVVILCLGILFSDAIVVACGATVGLIGIALVVVLGTVTWSLF